MTANGLDRVLERGVYRDGQWVQFLDDDEARTRVLLDVGIPEEQLHEVGGLVGRIWLVMEWLRQIEALANNPLQGFMLDPPLLESRIPMDVTSVVRGQGLTWLTDSGVPINRLSRAEKAWVALSLQLSLTALTGETLRTAIRWPGFAAARIREMCR